MEKRNRIFLIGSFLIALITILIVDVSFLKITYYSEFNMFGPFSRYPLIILAQFLLPIVFMAILLKRRETSPVILLIPLILLIVVKHMGVELADKYYVTSFYDGWQLFDRGIYVTITGHSNPQVDPYFDVQSGFFWVTAIMLNIWGIPASAVDLTLILFVKMFPVFASVVYLPILYILYQRLLRSHLLLSLALILFFGMNVCNFHYASQQYAWVLYWLILFFVFNSIDKKDDRCSTLAILTGLSLVFLHQGVIIFAILALIASAVYPVFFKILSKDNRFCRRESFKITSILFVIWLSYLIYMTIYTFRNFVEILRIVVETWFSEGAYKFPQLTSRSYEAWEQVVYYKAIYLFALVSIGLILSFVNAIKGGREEDKVAFGVQLFSAIFIGPVSVALGGAGYIERLFVAVLPLITYSSLRFISNLNIKAHKIIRSLTIVLLITLVLLGSIFYLSGRNFQSILEGVHFSRIFLVDRDPQSIVGVYSGSKVVSIREIVPAILSIEQEHTLHAELVTVERHAIIETYYYVCANMSFINEVISDLNNQMMRIYDNNDAIILYPYTEM